MLRYNVARPRVHGIVFLLVAGNDSHGRCLIAVNPGPFNDRHPGNLTAAPLTILVESARGFSNPSQTVPALQPPQHAATHSVLRQLRRAASDAAARCVFCGALRRAAAP